MPTLRTSMVLVAAATGIALATVATGQEEAKEPSRDPNVIENAFLIAIWQNDVPAKEPGVITELMVEEGDTVPLDHLIAQIDDRDAKMTFMVAAKKYTAAKVQADSDVSVRAAAKQRDLFAIELEKKLNVNARVPDAVSPTEIRETIYRRDRAILEIEASEHQMKVASAERDAAKAEAQRAKGMLENRQVKSPVEGFGYQGNSPSGNLGGTR